MFGKMLSHLLGNGVEDSQDIVADAFEELLEFEDGEWVVVKFQENLALSDPGVDPLENLLIEHPSMSVYQNRTQLNEEEEEEEEEHNEEVTLRLVPVRRHISWMLAAWGSPLPGSELHLLSLPRARTQMERRKLSRSANQRQNLVKTLRFPPAERRYGHFKQPCQRPYNF